MLHEFLSSNREELISRCREKVGKRAAPETTNEELQFGIPIFLTQLIKILHEEGPDSTDDATPPWNATEPAIGMAKTASEHGNELWLARFTVTQVVHDYGDLCQAITELAMETAAKITNGEFHTLNRCLDNAIAGAVSEYARNGDRRGADESSLPGMNGSLTLSEKQLNLIHMAISALDAIKRGNVGISGATGGVLDHSLKSLLDLTAHASATDGLAPAESPKNKHSGA